MGQKDKDYTLNIQLLSNVRAMCPSKEFPFHAILE